MTQAIAVLMLSVVLAQDTPQGRLVTPLGTLTDDPMAASGITYCAGVTGECIAIVAFGTVPAEAAEPIAIGDKLTPDVDGKMAVAEGDDPVYALAWQSASAAGQLIEVQIK